jgi:hypothetical protein
MNPARYVKVFGASFVKDYAEHPMITIGSDILTRPEAGKLGIVQRRSCAILEGIAKELGARNIKHFYELTSPYVLVEHPFGVVSLFVLWALFDYKDLDVEAWYKAGKMKAFENFQTLKTRELKARERQRVEDKSRARKARRGHHEHDVKQFLQTAARS